ncbi:MAG: hypothetical protein SGJ19_04530, partial [Planctomycetia bacterium]|nr:hypothetical protein [Planctomycetia bacterium]
RHQPLFFGLSSIPSQAISNRLKTFDLKGFFAVSMFGPPSHADSVRLIAFQRVVGKLLGKIFASHGFPTNLESDFPTDEIVRSEMPKGRGLRAPH